MKLVSLYIENFGGLSQYSLRFGDGLTVIQEPNGFGKTTLAEFIRAMFYGFPRKSKTLEKSRRQKYTPWNGGKCGGNLIFEFENQCYRIERTFGTTPKSDTFRLIDLATNKKSERFSEEIGVELFQLDADSFERSTYMPQLHDSSSLSTNTIQAKLTRLVEDTGDINNYDRAMEALKGKRGGFVPYRGNGGSVGEARDQISTLQNQLDQAQLKRDELQSSQKEILRLEEQLQQKNTEIDAVRAEITMVSEAAAAAAVRREYEQLRQQRRADQERLEQLGAVYPNGVPNEEKIVQAEQIARRAAVLAAQQITTQSDLDARDYVEQNRSRFEERVPDQDQLEQRRRQHRSYESLLTEAQSIGLSGQETLQYGKLLPLYESGALEEAYIDDLSQQNRELEKLHHSLDSLTLPQEDVRRLEELKGFFAAGLPDSEEIEQHRKELLDCDQLRQETARLAAGVVTASPRKSASPVPMILLLLMGIGGTALGVVLLVKQMYLYGGIGLGVGVLALIGAVFLGLRMMLSRELSGRAAGFSPEVQARIDGNRVRIEQLEQSAGGFVQRYTVGKNLSDGLHEIEDKASDYRMLTRREKALQEQSDVLEVQAVQLRTGLEARLGKCPEFGKAIMELHLARGQFLDLQAEKTAAETQRDSLLSQAEEIRSDLTRFLRAYYENVTPERFGGLLAALQRDAEGYLRCKAQVASWDKRKNAHETEVEACAGELRQFFGRCCLQQEDDVLRQLQNIRDDGDEMRRIFARSGRLEQRIKELESEESGKLFAPAPEKLPDPEALKEHERQLNSELTALTRQLLQERQNCKLLRGEVDRIPQLQDELNFWQEKKNSGQKKAAILDDTMDFLQQAKDSLSGSFLGPIREHFAEYINRLTGQLQENVLISPDLEVQLERHGQARELAFFSAGQTDLVMLCMRLALVDALFTQTKPFIILDDPFVNLDDERTAQALELLQELSKDHQILYLVCNSSRSL